MGKMHPLDLSQELSIAILHERKYLNPFLPFSLFQKQKVYLSKKDNYFFFRFYTLLFIMKYGMYFIYVYTV